MAHSGRKTLPFTGCNKQHIGSYSVPDYQTHSTSQPAVKGDPWVLYLKFLGVPFELEATRERKRKNGVCAHNAY